MPNWFLLAVGLIGVLFVVFALDVYFFDLALYSPKYEEEMRRGQLADFSVAPLSGFYYYFFRGYH